MLSRLSIRARLTIAFAAAMVLVLLLAGLFVYVKVEDNLSESLDESLQARADDVAAAVSNTPAGQLDLGRQRFGDSEDSFVQVLDTGGGPAESAQGDGLVLDSTLPPGAGPVLTPAETSVAAQDSAYFDRDEVEGVDGDARVLARPVTAFDRHYVVVVGASTQDQDETLAALQGAFVLGGALALLLASGLGYLLAGRALAPVEAMRGRAAEITLERSGERLPLPEADDEIRHLGETLNTMLDRIEASLERERVFVADASHELRTPLAILKAELELAAREGRSPEELRAAIASAGEEVDRLTRLAEDLLVIARSDRGRLPIKREPVELGRMLAHVRDRFERRAASEGRALELRAPERARAALDPMRIEQALGNLLDNALRHGRGAIALGAIRDGDGIELWVTDEGPGMDADFERGAFERFSRADEGRTGGGAGLGLAIVRAIARAHGGEVRAEGPRIVLTIPDDPRPAS